MQNPGVNSNYVTVQKGKNQHLVSTKQQHISYYNIIITDRGCSGALDWIIEIISPSNPEYDYIDKLDLYKRTGVREYWIVDPQRERIFANIYNDLWIV